MKTLLKAHNISFQKVNDTYLKIFDTNIVNTELKPDNYDTPSDIDFNLENENFVFNSGFTVYENLAKQNSDRYQYVLPYYDFQVDFLMITTLPLCFSQGDNILKNTNSLRSRMINNLTIQSYDYFLKNGIKNNLNYYLKNTISAGKNNTEYDSSPQVKLMNIFELVSSFPLINVNENYVDYLRPKVSLRINPSSMKNYKDENRQINNDNIFNIDRLGLIDTLESGQNLTLGFYYKKDNQ